jgi:undecaprenyl diphosphate synthase
MDGNRRFARSHGIETVEGHNLGFEALARVGRLSRGRSKQARLEEIAKSSFPQSQS